MEIKNVLVTGSDGYIGAVLVKKLIEQGFKVVAWDNQYYKDSVLGNYKLSFPVIKKDIRKTVKSDLKKMDAIIHLAALSNDPLGELDAKITEEINYLATVNLAKYAKKMGVKKFIFSSSCSIYGIAKNGIVSEKSKLNPLTAYAKSKIKSEKELKKIADKNFCVCLLRNSTVYGFSPKFRTDLVVNDFTARGFSTGEIKVLSDGTPWRPLIDVRDLSDIFIEFLKNNDKKINGKVFNIGFKENNFQIRDVLSIIKKELPKCKITFTGEHGKDTRSYRVNFNKFNKQFPYIKQNWTLQKSVKDLINNLRNNNFDKAQFESNIYSRIFVLKNLLERNKINKKLIWIK